MVGRPAWCHILGEKKYRLVHRTPRKIGPYFEIGKQGTTDRQIFIGFDIATRNFGNVFPLRTCIFSNLFQTDNISSSEIPVKSLYVVNLFHRVSFRLRPFSVSRANTVAEKINKNFEFIVEIFTLNKTLKTPDI